MQSCVLRDVDVLILQPSVRPERLQGMFLEEPLSQEHPLTCWSEGLRKDNRKGGEQEKRNCRYRDLIQPMQSSDLCFREKGDFGAIFCSLWLLHYIMKRK